MTAWTAKEVAALQRLAGAPIAEVCAALPRHHKSSIRAAFQRHGIRRVMTVAPPAPVHPLVARLRELRMARKMSVSELARRAKIQRSSLSVILRGGHQPGLSTLERLCRALGQRIELVPINGAGESRPEPVVKSL